MERRQGERHYESSCSSSMRIPLHRSTASIIHRKLAGIIEQLRPLSRQRGLLKFLKNVDHAGTLNGFVKDLAYAVTDYQVCASDSTT